MVKFMNQLDECFCIDTFHTRGIKEKSFIHSKIDIKIDEKHAIKQ